MSLKILTAGVMGVHTEDYSVPSSELASVSDGFLNPRSANALQQGEWLIPDGSGNYDRHSSVVGTELPGTAITRLAKCVWTPNGDIPAQALGKVTLVNSNDWEGETDQYEGSISEGTELTAKVDADGIRCVLAPASSTKTVVAICTVAPANGVVQFKTLQPYVK